MNANAIDSLDTQVKSMVTSREAFIKHFTRDDIISYIDYLINNHIVVIDSMKLFGEVYMRALAKDIVGNKDVVKQGLLPYINFKKLLKNKALSMESSETLSGIKAANENYIAVLNELKDKITDYFTSDKVNIFNMRLSHVILVGVMYQSEQLSKFTKYMITLISFAMQGSKEDLPDYRIVFIQDNIENMASCVNAIVAGTGANEFGKLINNIKVNTSDFTLLTDDNTVQVKRAGNVTLGDNGSQMLASGTAGLFGFRWLGEFKNRRKDWKEKQRLSEEEWLKAHVAILMLKLDKIPETDPEYQKLKKIIERYEIMINKYERTRNKKD